MCYVIRLLPFAALVLLADYANIVPPKSLLGMSLRPVAERKPVDWRPNVVAENDTGRMLRSERYKYCVYKTGEARESLTDLQTDPGELKNLAANPEYKDILRTHRRMLSEWIEKSGDSDARTFAFQ